MKKSLLILVVLFAFKSGFAQTAAMLASETVLKNAYTKAAKENKKVMLIFHASWCGWCKKMAASLNDPSVKQMFDDNYVIATLNVLEQPAKKNLENPGSLEILTKFKGERSGLPFWLILDANGNVLADSQIKGEAASSNPGASNIGCPASEKEVAYLTGILKSTSKLNDAQLVVISKRFLQNQPAPVDVEATKTAAPVSPAMVGSK